MQRFAAEQCFRVWSYFHDHKVQLPLCVIRHQYNIKQDDHEAIYSLTVVRQLPYVRRSHDHEDTVETNRSSADLDCCRNAAD